MNLKKKWHVFSVRSSGGIGTGRRRENGIIIRNNPKQLVS